MVDAGLRFRSITRPRSANAWPAIAASLALTAALACGAARAAAIDAETPDYLVPDTPAATIAADRDAEGRLQIHIGGERFDGRRLITRLLADLRDPASTAAGADFDLRIEVA